MKNLAVFCGVLFMTVLGESRGDCFSDSLKELKQVRSYSVSGEYIHSPSCGGCCLLPRAYGGCNPPHRSASVEFKAPDGFKITSKNFKVIKSGGDGEAEWKDDIFNDGNRVKVILEYETSSEKKPAGAGAWRQYEIFGNYERILTESDYMNAAKKCTRE